MRNNSQQARAEAGRRENNLSADSGQNSSVRGFKTGNPQQAEAMDQIVVSGEQEVRSKVRLPRNLFGEADEEPVQFSQQM